MRRTSATNALGSSLPTKVVSECLGHASPQIPSARVISGMDADAATLVGSLLDGLGDPQPAAQKEEVTNP